MNKKLIFFDIDGTLLNSNKKINESTIRAIEDLKEKGFIFCIATGRGLTEGILEIAKIAKLNGYLVLGNGNFVWDLEEDKLYTIGLPLNIEVLNEFHHLAKKYKRQLNLFFQDGTIKSYYFGNDISKEIKDCNFYIAGPSVYNYSDTSEIENDFQKPIVHISLKAENEIIKKCYPILKEWNDKKIAQVSNVLNVYVEAESFGISKWTGVQFVQNKAKISNENTYAFGDSFNDKILLENVGNSICMGNGENEMKKIAKITIGSNDTDAIAEFLYTIE